MPNLKYHNFKIVSITHAVDADEGDQGVVEPVRLTNLEAALQSWSFEGSGQSATYDEDDEVEEFDFDDTNVGYLLISHTVNAGVIREIRSIRGNTGELRVVIALNDSDGAQVCAHTFAGYAATPSAFSGDKTSDSEMVWDLTIGCTEAFLYEM